MTISYVIKVDKSYVFLLINKIKWHLLINEHLPIMKLFLILYFDPFETLISFYLNNIKQNKEMENEEENIKTRILYANTLHQEKPRITDKYGFIKNSESELDSKNRKGLIDMSNKWNPVIEHIRCKGVREYEKINKLIFKGVPLFLKYRIWHSLAHNIITVDYNELCSMLCGYEHQIHVDVQRTLRSHSLFCDKYGHGQCRLFNVLVAFANYKPEIGYCQGMSSFVGVILMYFPEREAFELLVSLIEKNRLYGLFDKNLSKLPLILSVQEGIFKETIPEIYHHLKKNEIDPGVFAFSWYLTLYTRFNIKLSLRIWDIFVFYDFTVFLFASSAILKSVSNVILSSTGESLIEFMTNIESYDFNVNRVLKLLKRYMSNGVDYHREKLGLLDN